MTHTPNSNSADSMDDFLSKDKADNFNSSYETMNEHCKHDTGILESIVALPQTLLSEDEDSVELKNTEQEDQPNVTDLAHSESSPIEIEDESTSNDNTSIENVVGTHCEQEHSDGQIDADHWWIAGASYIGNMHIEKGIECQDSYQFKKLANDTGVAVVCDGAGSKINSKQGAELTAEKTVEWLSQKIENGTDITKESLPNIANELYEYIYSQLKQYSEENDLPFESLGSTLIAVVYDAHRLACFHIGDGRAAYQDFADKSWKPLIEPWNTEEGYTIFTTTNEVQEADAPRSNYIRSKFIPQSVASFVIMTDGCENASFECQVFDKQTEKYIRPNRPFPGFFNPVKKQLISIHQHFSSLKDLTKEDKQKNINNVWEKFLREGTPQLAKEADDRTMVFAINSVFNDD